MSLLNQALFSIDITSPEKHDAAEKAVATFSQESWEIGFECAEALDDPDVLPEVWSVSRESFITLFANHGVQLDGPNAADTVFRTDPLGRLPAAARF